MARKRQPVKPVLREIPVEFTEADVRAMERERAVYAYERRMDAAKTRLCSGNPACGFCNRCIPVIRIPSKEGC